MTIQEAWMSQSYDGRFQVVFFEAEIENGCNKCGATILGGAWDTETDMTYCKQCAETTPLKELPTSPPSL